MPDSPPLTPVKPNKHAERAEHLARALRENLHRRKAQARAKQAQQETGAAAPPQGEPAA